MILTDSKIKSFKAKEKDYYVWHDTETKNTGRVGMRIFPSGRKVFVYRYYENKKARFVNLGDYPIIMLSEAIKKSNEILSNLNQPVKTIKMATVEQLFNDYMCSLYAQG